MDGMLELTLIHVEADGLAIYLLGERRTGMAAEAIGIFQLLRRMRDRDPGNQNKNQQTNRTRSNSFHSIEETLRKEAPAVMRVTFPRMVPNEAGGDRLKTYEKPALVTQECSQFTASATWSTAALDHREIIGPARQC